MRNIITMALLITLLTGCSLMGTQNTDSTEVETSDEAQIAQEILDIETVAPVETKEYTTDDFYFESGQDGITLRHRENTDFSQKLSDQPIESAEIIEGLLMFQEKNGLQAQKVFNLEEIIENWK